MRGFYHPLGEYIFLIDTKKIKIQHSYYQKKTLHYSSKKFLLQIFESVRDRDHEIVYSINV